MGGHRLQLAAPAMNSTHANAVATLPVGDPRRARAGRAILLTLTVAAIFLAFAFASKEIEPIYSHAPWEDDPYDAVVSFTLFFVALLAGLCLLRVPLCKRVAPVPVRRLQELLRGCRLILAAALITVTSDWLGVGLRANRHSWNADTALLVVALGVVTVAALWAAWSLRAATREPLLAEAHHAAGSDWLADCITVVERLCIRLGRSGEAALGVVRWGDRIVAGFVRSHALLAAGVLATAFGLGIAATQTFEGGLRLPVSLLYVLVGFSGMFAFVVSAGAYLHVVDSVGHLGVVRRRAVAAAVAGSASIPMVLALRSELPWTAGVAAHGAPWHLIAVLLSTAAVVAIAVLLGAMLARAHRRNAPVPPATAA
jgi:hypothetical protein